MGEINNVVNHIGTPNPNYVGNPAETRDPGISGVAVTEDNPNQKVVITLTGLDSPLQASRAVAYDETGQVIAETTDVSVNVIRFPEDLLDYDGGFTIALLVVLKDGQIFSIPVVKEAE